MASVKEEQDQILAQVSNQGDVRYCIMVDDKYIAMKLCNIF